MDAIKKEAGVALNTLYRHFPSKEALVEAYLRQRDARWRRWLAGYVERRTDPRERLLAIFDAPAGWFGSENFRGCAFINVAGEIGGGDDGIRRLAGEHKRAVSAYVERLVKEAGCRSPQALSRGLMLLLVEGAIVTAYVEGDLSAAQRAKEVAGAILERKSAA